MRSNKCQKEYLQISGLENSPVERRFCASGNEKLSPSEAEKGIKTNTHISKLDFVSFKRSKAEHYGFRILAQGLHDLGLGGGAGDVHLEA